MQCHQAATNPRQPDYITFVVIAPGPEDLCAHVQRKVLIDLFCLTTAVLLCAGVVGWWCNTHACDSAFCDKHDRADTTP